VATEEYNKTLDFCFHLKMRSTFVNVAGILVAILVEYSEEGRVSIATMF